MGFREDVACALLCREASLHSILSLQQIRVSQITLELGEGWGLVTNPEQDIAEECSTHKIFV